MRVYKRIISAILECILPSKCLSCDELTGEIGLCGICWNKLQFISHPYCATCGKQLPSGVGSDVNCIKCMMNQPQYIKARAVLKFDEQTKKMVHHFKYYDKTVFAKVFANIIYNAYARDLSSAHVIVPVPMHRFRLLARRYNHSFLLAKELGKISGIMMRYNVLFRTKWTKSQTFLTKQQRLENIKNAFCVKNIEIIKDKHVLLVDDVMTTSATINECCNVLNQYAKSVTVVCVAFA